MIDYETFCKIREYHTQRALKTEQIAHALGLDGRTVAKWIDEPRYRPRHAPTRASKLDAFKSQIRQWLEAHPYSAQQIFQRLREDGFDGGITIVKEYVRTVRPRRAPAYLTLTFAPRSIGGYGARCPWARPGASSRSLSWCCAGAA